MQSRNQPVGKRFGGISFGREEGIIPGGVFGIHQMATTGNVELTTCRLVMGSCEHNFTTKTLTLNISFTKYAGNKAKKVVFGAVIEPILCT